MTGSSRHSFNRRRPQEVRLIGLARNFRVTPKPPADLNPLKDLDLTEGQTFGIPSARLGFPSARFGFPSDWLGFPSAQLGIPSVRLGTASFRPSGAASPRIASGPGRRRPAWELQFLGRVTHNPLKRPVSVDKNRVKIVSEACPIPAQHASWPRPNVTPVPICSKRRRHCKM
jgi:hypothetical protein